MLLACSITLPPITRTSALPLLVPTKPTEPRCICAACSANANANRLNPWPCIWEYRSAPCSTSSVKAPGRLSRLLPSINCCSVGKVANSQVGVYLGYASRKGYTLLDGQLFLPELWFGEAYADKRKATEMPTTLERKTKPE